MYLRFCLLFCVLFFDGPSAAQAQSTEINAYCDSLYRTKTQAGQQAMITCYQQQLEQVVFPPSQTALIHYRLAQGYAFVGAFADAVQAYQTAIETVEDPIRRMHYQEELAYAYETYGRALGQALALREQLLVSIMEFGHASPQVLSIWCENHIRLAILHQQMGRWDIAESYFQEAEYLVYEVGDDRLLFLFQLNWAYFLLERKRAREAFRVIEQCWRQQNERGEKRLIERLFAQVLMGQVYLALDQAAKALPLLLSAQDELANREQGDFLFHLYLKQEISACFRALGRWESAIQVLEASITELEEQTVLEYTQINLLTLAELNEQKAQALFQQAQLTGSVNAAPAFEAALQALQYLEQALATFSKAEDQYYHLEDYYPVIETYLELAFHAYQHTQEETYAELALKAMEQSQNLLLRAQLDQQQASSHCSPELLAAWQSACRELHQIQLRCRTQKAFRAKRHSPGVLSDYHEMIAQQRKCRQLESRLREHCGEQMSGPPAAYASVSLRKLRRRLEPGESLVQYALGERHSFVLLVNQQTVQFQRIERSIAEWEEQIAQFRAALYQSVSSGNPGDWEQWEQQSLQLYQALLGSFAPDLTEKLVIIPDGPLFELPFAALLTAESSSTGEQRAFLLQERTISYRYSALNIQLGSPKKRQIESPAVLAVAPDFPAVRMANAERSAQLTGLNNFWEVDQIAEYFPTTLLKGMEANVARFWSLAPDYAVIHLATHAVADAQTGLFSYLAMGQEPATQLTAADLYARHIPADLVVLSACETGLGEWQRGEGIIGLQRAFFAAGAQSLVTTQWKVSDEASAALMGLFYSYLAEEIPKDEALRAAQLHFMEKYPDQGHPFYWAAYNVLGNTAPLGGTDSRKNRRWLIILGLILAAIVIQKRRHALKY